MTSVANKKVFVSYAVEDRSIAERLRADLSGASVDTFQFEKSARPGDVAWAQVLAAINESDMFVVLLSEHSLASAAVRHEIQHALWRKINHGAPRLVPITLESIRVPNELAVYTSLRYSDHDVIAGQLMALLGERQMPAGQVRTKWKSSSAKALALFAVVGTLGAGTWLTRGFWMNQSPQLVTRLYEVSGCDNPNERNVRRGVVTTLSEGIGCTYTFLGWTVTEDWPGASREIFVGSGTGLSNCDRVLSPTVDQGNNMFDQNDLVRHEPKCRYQSAGWLLDTEVGPMVYSVDFTNPDSKNAPWWCVLVRQLTVDIDVHAAGRCGYGPIGHAYRAD